MVSEDDKETLLELVKLAKDGFLEVFADTIGVLGEGIKAGKTNIPLGLLAYQNYCDLLHGGAYTTPVDQLTYYNTDVQAALAWGGELNAQRFLTGSITVKLANGRTVTLPGGAKPEQVEIILNSAGGAKHRFPKLLSDQAYYLTKEWISLYMTSGLVTQTTTNVATLVEAGGDFLGGQRGLAGLIRTPQKTAQPTTK